jgi:hypothetical protein
VRQKDGGEIAGFKQKRQQGKTADSEKTVRGLTLLDNATSNEWFGLPDPGSGNVYTTLLSPHGALFTDGPSTDGLPPPESSNCVHGGADAGWLCLLPSLAGC